MVGISFQGVDNQKPFFERSDFKIQGSGVSLGNGYILTNFHVVSRQMHDGSIQVVEEFTVVTYNFNEYEAELVGYDNQADVAVIRLKKGEIYASRRSSRSSGRSNNSSC